MNELITTLVAADEVLVTVFGRLFENEFATLDGIAMSRRTPDGLRYLDQSVALSRLLGEAGTSASRSSRLTGRSSRCTGPCTLRPRRSTRWSVAGPGTCRRCSWRGWRCRRPRA